MIPASHDTVAPRWHKWVLLALLMCALSLRLYGIDWDQAHFYHPDERFIIQFKVPELRWPGFDLELLLNPTTSPWNPRWFAYGSFPLYQLSLIRQAALALDPTFGLDNIRLVGRALSAFFDAGSITMLYLLGRRLYDSRVGLLAAAFMTFAVISIQLSHFTAFDVQLTFWVLVALYGAARVMQRCDALGIALTGIGVGLGFATKASLAPLLVPIAVAYLLYAWYSPESNRLTSAADPARLRRATIGIFSAGLLALALFSIAQPYAWLDWATFTRDLQEQSEMALRVRDYPYTRQYDSTTPYLYHIQQLATWGLGQPLGIVVWLAFAFTTVRAFIRRRPEDLLLMAWVLPYFLFYGATPVKYLRYLLPITPILLLFAARMLLLWKDSRRPDASPNPATFSALTPLRWVFRPSTVIVAVLLTTVWYALAFTNLYRTPHPATELSAWINANAPAGSLILREHWEEGVPALERYKQEELTLYEPDNTAKLDRMSDQLQRANYIVFFSNRLYGTIPRLDKRYPMTTLYYQLLFSGQLGYRLVESTATYPSFLGITLMNDTFARPNMPRPDGLTEPGGLVIRPGYADESFTVYDHPMTLLFQKSEPLSAAQFRTLLQPGLPSASGRPVEGPLLSPQDLQTQRAGGAWVNLFQPDSISNQHPWFLWLVTAELVGLLAFPVAFWLFPSFPDRGFLPAKMLGILLLGYATWLVAALHLLPLTRGTIAMGVGVMALIGGLLFYRQRVAIIRYIRGNWRLIVALESLYLLAFFAFFLIRLANPDLWHPARGGEKPMDFAYLNAIIKSTTMPPYDPWYSGGNLNYYYFGQVMIAALIKLTAILPEYAYNLAIPTLFALTTGAACSIGAALLAAQGRRRNIVLLAGGATVAVGIAVLGNLDGAVQVMTRLQDAGKLSLTTTIPGLLGILELGNGLFQVLVNHVALPHFDYWQSRALGSMDQTFIDRTLNAPSISITEFPFFTFLFADLHAHLIALPLTLLGMGIALQLALGTSLGAFRRLATLALFGLVLGAIRWTNTWDFPTYIVVGAAAIAVCGARGRLGVGYFLNVGFQVVLFLAFSLLFFRPFESNYINYYSGGIETSPEATPFGLYFRIHGLFLTIIIGFIAFELVQRFRSTGLVRLIRLALHQPSALFRFLRIRQRLSLHHSFSDYLPIIAILVLVEIALMLVARGAATDGFLLLFLSALALLAWREVTQPTRERGGAYLFALALAGGAAGLSMVVDTIKLDIPGEVQRMNNVFKIYFQVWSLYAVSATYALWWAIGRWRNHDAAPARRSWSVEFRGAWATAVGALVFGAMFYPLLATPERTADRFHPLPLTKDGMAYMQHTVYQTDRGPLDLKQDYDGIQWLRNNVQGSPVVLEAVTPIYQWGSRISIYTGLPTVLGWDWHQTQQRWDTRESIERRKIDVTSIYTSPVPADALALLRRYQVSYIYVGQLERQHYPAVGIDKFATMATQGALERVYQNDQVSIYKVRG